jgi:hypothetical protein
MSISIIVATVLFCFYLFQYISEKEKAEKEEDQSFQELMNGEQKEDDDMKEQKCLDERTITGLVLTTLRKIGCDPETEEHNNLNYAYFTFQGEKFTIESNDTCNFITIYDTWWHSISIYSDVEEIANLHKTINLVNQYVNCTLLYTANKEIEEIGVHSRRTILFVKEIPEIDKYLLCVLSDFFKAQRLVLTELEKCKVTEV